MTPGTSFPRYTAAELVLDQALHAFAVLLAVGGIAWLFAAVLPARSAHRLIGLAVYSVGLISMFVTSAAYNSCFLVGPKNCFAVLIMP
jgi:predicted membrane channel-forming protein YqfA (hemolysin III family)